MHFFLCCCFSFTLPANLPSYQVAQNSRIDRPTYFLASLFANRNTHTHSPAATTQYRKSQAISDEAFRSKNKMPQHRNWTRSRNSDREGFSFPKTPCGVQYHEGAGVIFLSFILSFSGMGAVRCPENSRMGQGSTRAL